MTTEEKAKAYDEAVKKAQCWLNDPQTIQDCNYTIEDAIQNIFPQFKESEDEKIGNVIYCIVRDNKEVKRILEGNGISLDNALAYLERQKDLAAIPDELVKNYKLFCENGRREVAVLINAINGINEQKEQKPAEWSAKGRRGRIGSTPEHIRKKAENFLSKMEPPYDADDICSAYETGAMENANSSWSEEDEEMLSSCISSIEEAKENRYAYKETDGDTSYDHEIAWLKSLRPVSKESLQPHWKPSKEQMDAVKHAYNSFPNDCFTKSNLRFLYHDLEKLGVREGPEYYQHFDPDC